MQTPRILTGRAVTGGALALALALSPAACDDGSPTTTRPDGGIEAGSSQPLLDGKLGEAVAAAAASGAADAGPAPAASGAPPETGVFGPGQAEAAHARTAPVKIEVLGDGEEPRALLAPRFPDKGEHKATVSVGVRLGPQQAIPTIDFELALKIDKPKKAAEAKAPAAPEPAAGVTRVVAKIAAATIAGAAPKELGDEVKKLKGSVIRFSVGPSGAAGDYQVERSKDADPGLEAPLSALVEAVSILTPPLPSKPVGVGAYWMATDRSGSVGVDVVRYRVFKVEKVDGADVTLSVECRQYAADPKMSLAMGPEKVEFAVERFDSHGKGQLGVGGFLPSRGELLQKTQAVVQRGQGQGAQKAAVQTEVTTKVR